MIDSLLWRDIQPSSPALIVSASKDSQNIFNRGRPRPGLQCQDSAIYLPIHEPRSSSVGSVLLATCSWGNSTAEYPMGIPAPAASRNAAPDTNTCKCSMSQFSVKLKETGSVLALNCKTNYLILAFRRAFV